MGDYIEGILYGTIVGAFSCIVCHSMVSLYMTLCHAVETSKNLIYYNNSTAMVEPGGHRSLGMTLRWDSTSGGCCYCCAEMV